MFLANWCMIVVPSLQAMVLASGHRGATRVGAALAARGASGIGPNEPAAPPQLRGDRC